MNRSSILSLLLVLLLAACELVPVQTATRPQAQPRRKQPASMDAQPRLLDQRLGQKLQAALEAAVASPNIKWPGAVLYVSAPGLGDVKTQTAMRPHDPAISDGPVLVAREYQAPVLAVVPGLATGRY